MITSARPNDPPIPAPMPARAPVDDNDDVASVPEMDEPLDADDVAARDVVEVAVVLTVTDEAASGGTEGCRAGRGFEYHRSGFNGEWGLASFGATDAAVGGGLRLTTAGKIIVV